MDFCQDNLSALYNGRSRMKVSFLKNLALFLAIGPADKLLLDKLFQLIYLIGEFNMRLDGAP